MDKDKERLLTRREFLKLSTLVTGASMLGGSTLLDKVLPTEVGRAEDYILAPKPIIVGHPVREHSIEKWEIRVNPEGFYEALIYTAWREDGKEGLGKLDNFLRRNSIPVELVGNFPKSKKIGDYTPSFWINGPELKFLRSLIVERYIADEFGRDLTGEGLTSYFIEYHEVFHVWQEVRNQPGTVLAAAAPNLSDYEQEATQKSWEIMQERTRLGRPIRFFTATRRS